MRTISRRTSRRSRNAHRVQGRPARVMRVFTDAYDFLPSQLSAQTRSVYRYKIDAVFYMRIVDFWSVSTCF